MKPNNKRERAQKNETHEGNKIKITLHCRISCGLHEINMSCVSFSFLALPHFYNVPQLFRIVHHFLSMVFLFISSSIFGKTKSNEKDGYGKRWRRSETERNRERVMVCIAESNNLVTRSKEILQKSTQFHLSQIHFQLLFGIHRNRKKEEQPQIRCFHCNISNSLCVFLC